jgi:hypothetical protein
MNELENIQKQGTKHWKDTAPAMAKLRSDENGQTGREFWWSHGFYFKTR